MKGATINASIDGGANWSLLHTASTNLSGIRQLANGELLISTRATGGTPGSLYLSTGYPTLGAGATWAKVLDAGQGGIGGSSYFDGLWGMSVSGSNIVVCEYGLQNPGDQARRVYLSTNSGADWSLILDVGNAANLHTHGCAYDPVWDAIWVCTGDGVNRSTRVTFDDGANWTIVDTALQFVSILPMSDCVLFLTDAPVNGVYRLNRVDEHITLILELAYRMDWSGALTQIGGMPFRLPGENTLAILPFISNGVGYGKIVTTRDGVSFQDIWQDSISYDTKGPYTLVGPTMGQLIGDLNDGRQANHSRIVF